jgi:hypothetical protein
MYCKTLEKIMTIENVFFETAWNETTIHLADKEPTTRDKIMQVALNVFSILLPPLGIARLIDYKINCFANRVSLPSAHYISKTHFETAVRNFNDFWEGPITEKNELIRKNYTLIRETVITPDKAALKAICMQYKNSTSETPTVIYFNGNFQLCVETPSWILPKSIEAGSPCNFVLFDYRGVGESKGVFKQAKDLVVDGSSIVEWVKQKIGIRGDQIHFYGFSLGGAISSMTKALDPKRLTGRLINDRSFSSSNKWLEVRYGSGYFGKLMNWFFTKHGYSADPLAAFQKASGEKMVIYHPDDAVIPTEASMQYALQHSLAIRLEPKPEFEEPSKENHHINPLHWYDQAVERVVEFLCHHKYVAEMAPS